MSSSLGARRRRWSDVEPVFDSSSSFSVTHHVPTSAPARSSRWLRVSLQASSVHSGFELTRTRPRLAGLTSAYLLATVPFLREDGTKLDVEVHLYEKVRNMTRHR